jgi:natural product biosynthesis luciferase-like monooxygenase protein
MRRSFGAARFAAFEVPMEPLSVVVMGDESLLIECSTQVLQRGHRVLAVCTSDPRVAKWAASQTIPVVEPGSGLTDNLPADFDYFLSIANLRMVPPAALSKARHGGVNFHDGPLPAYAGLNAPVWALIAGEEEHGVTWHVMEDGPDQGAILVQRTFPIDPADTALALNAKCYEVGVETFAELLPLLESREAKGLPQDAARRTYFAKHARPKALGLLDFDVAAEESERLVRALSFGTYRNPIALPKLSANGHTLHPTVCAVVPNDGGEPAGTVLSLDETSLVVSCSDGAVRLSDFVRNCGTPVTPVEVASELGLAPGFRLQTSADDRRALDELSSLVRHEDFWAARLARLQGTDAPLAHPGAAPSTTPRRIAVQTAGASEAELVAAFVAWLARLNANPRVMLGSVDQGRPLFAWESVFARQVPFELECAADATFGALSRAATDELARIRKHGTYARDLVARTPRLGLPRYAVGLDLNAEKGAELRGRQLVLAIQGGRAELLFDEAAYSEAVAVDIVSQITEVLARGRAEQECLVARLPLVSEAMRRVLVQEYNATELALPPERLVHLAFEEQVRRTPEKIALTAQGKSLSYEELNRRANRLAHRLIELGAARDKLVGIYLPRTEDLVVAVLAVLKSGAAYLPLDPGYPKERIAFMLQDGQAKIVVTLAELSKSLAEGATRVCLDTDPELGSKTDGNPDVSSAPKDLAYVIYTSGSTGKPKGVMVEHHNVVNFFAGMDQRIPRGENDTWLAVTSLSFDISVLELLWTLTRGFKVVLLADGRLDSAPGASPGLELEFSLFYFASDEGGVGADKYRLLLEGARFADERGFAAVWTPERHFGAFGGLYPNPAVAGAAVAAITKNVRIRAGSCVLPLHHPIRVAEEWALVDNLSNGRVGISFASGWHPNDFVLRPENFSQNKAVMMRDIEVVRRLWRGEKVSFPGAKGDVAVQTLPRPVQSDLPIWLTAAGSVETFEAAGRIGAGLLTHLLGQTLEEVKTKVAAYRRAWREAGHPGRGCVTLMLHTFVGDDDEVVKEKVREPMKGYLRSSLALIAQHAWSFPAFKRAAKDGASFNDNFMSLSSEDMDALLDYSFERYYETAGLFGSRQTCLKTLGVVKGCDVDEIACLIDYGVDTQSVLDQLPKLDELRVAATREPEIADNDFSLAAEMRRHRVTHFQCTPSMARMLLSSENGGSALRRLQCFMVGGEALTAGLAQDIHGATPAELLNMYGPTETTVWSSTDNVASDLVTLGAPIANTRLYVLDSNRELLPRGAAGELFIGGDGVTRGYLHRPELTAERFLDDPFVAGGRIYRTGDLVRYRADGKLEFLGRIDQQVKVRGFRIELGEIESVLGSAPGVREAVVIVREDVPGDSRIVAYYLPAAGSPPTAEQLREHLAAALPDYMVPAHFVELEAFPLTPNAKVDRKALPSPDVSRQVRTQEFVASEGDVEDTITKVWQELLGVPRVGATDNFFELGGHSLLAVRAHGQLRKTLGLDLSITDIFRYPTARGLRDLFASRADGGAAKPGAHLARAAARREALTRRAEQRGSRRT